MDYESFLDRKRQYGADAGFDPTFIPDFLFDFQKYLIQWAVQRGRSAIFSDCGTGKSAMQLVWAQNMARKTNKPMLILTPLAVASQTQAEAEKFGIEAARSTAGQVHGNITIANYERLHYFKPDDFGGVVCDESSILKSFDGARRNEITAFMRKVQYRLLCTATAAPNDYTELGTSSEALGELGHIDMLNRFFKNEQNTTDTKHKNMRSGEKIKWRFKKHAVDLFWRWVSSWARALRKPSDYGFKDGAFILPELIENEHVVSARSLAEGYLFALPAQGLKEQRDERRRTINERCEKAASLVDTGKPAIMWCHLNREGDLLSELVKDSVQVSGSDSDDSKERKFNEFSNGSIRVLIIKPKIGAWGMNWQHCSHMTFFPSHSYEQYYQSVRRCWRFGQKNKVVVDLVTTDGDIEVKMNLQRKSANADKMFTALVAHMNNAIKISKPTAITVNVETPSWLNPVQV